MRDYKRLKNEFETEMKICKEKIKVLQEQMRNGVEVKDKKEGKEIKLEETE